MPSCIYEDIDRFINNQDCYDSILYKSFSENDHNWYSDNKMHQNGPLIPRELLSFFGLHKIPNHNTTIELDISWFLRGKVFTRADVKNNMGIIKTRLKYYCEGNRAKRPESHLTCVYNPYFENLSGGALLVIGRHRLESGFKYEALIIDVDHEDLLGDLLIATGIPEAPSWGIVAKEESGQDIGEDLFQRIQKLAMNIYSTENALPSTKITSTEIWNLIKSEASYLQGRIRCPGLSQSGDPFSTAIRNAPGNMIRWFLEKLEFKLLRVMEKLHYPELYVKELRAGYGRPFPQTWNDLEDAFRVSLDEVVEVGKSLTQSRRSRAGYSFEWYIDNLLTEYDAKFERQFGTRNIDFRVHAPGRFIQLSAKTTTRERWKQVHMNSYFITLDRTVSKNKLKQIGERKLTLVVPEEDKKAIEHYKSSTKVISFKAFFRGLHS